MDKEVLREKRFLLRDIVVRHDVPAFRQFLEAEQAEIGNPEKLLAMDDEKLSEFMYAWKAHLPYLGDAYQEARNHLRKNKVQGLMLTPAGRATLSPDLVGWLKSNKQFPLCYQCQYFLEAPEKDGTSCMHLGGQPMDVACRGFRLVEERKP